VRRHHGRFCRAGQARPPLTLAMSNLPNDAALLVRNAQAQHGEYPRELEPILSRAGHRSARTVIETWPDYTPTRLHALAGLAARLELGQIWLKDESTRFGLGAFKSIGGAYAVYHFLESEIKRSQPNADVGAQALIAGAYRDITQNITVACASAGNHGRAVAWGAQLFGARCVVYLYQDVSPGRAAAIERLGARVDLSSPNYDEAVRRVAADAERNGWQVISDTAYEGYIDIPRDVMQGYTVLADEVLEQLGGVRPTHVFLQCGVGGFAGALANRLWQRLEEHRPVIILVEPTGAACFLESVRAAHRVTLPDVHSIMGGLGCAEVSLVAWDILRLAADWAVAIPDSAIPVMMRALHDGQGDDPSIIAGESGAAGAAALCCLCADQVQRDRLGLHGNARVLLFSTEGATDPATYARLTGLALTAPA
jgi:diaminopropionate ammonia-lyase